MVLEKRNGKWMIAVEHTYEAAHDVKIMEAMVIKTSQDYDQSFLRKDRPAFDRMLADDYFSTNENGKTKAEEITVMFSPDLQIESSEVAGRKVRVFRGNTAVETGTYKLKGTFKGRPFEETGRYTTTWVWRNLRWQIAADHSSKIEQN